MGDPARFRKFAAYVADLHKDRSVSIVDVASGKGQLQANLRQLGFTDITSWDKRKRNATTRRGYRYDWFDYRHAPRGYKLVVAMHPDQGTDEAIAYACKHRVPFVVCPCCILPSATNYGGSRSSFADWKRHLIGYARENKMRVTDVTLKFGGRNSVIAGMPL